jgi:tetratricopeptide (TPR) repeat protein
LESRQWKTLPVTDKSSAVELLATGVSAVKLKRLDLAAEAAERLQKMAAAVSTDKDTSYYSRTSQPLKIMHKEVAGMLALAQGKSDVGLKLLAEGVAIAEAMRPPNGAPNPVKPVHELYAEALFDAQQPAEAITVYHKSLRRTPNRPLSLLGLARSYVAIGDREAGRAQYRKLAEVWKNTGFPALQEAERYLASGDVNIDIKVSGD